MDKHGVFPFFQIPGKCTDLFFAVSPYTQYIITIWNKIHRFKDQGEVTSEAKCPLLKSAFGSLIIMFFTISGISLSCSALV